MDEGFFNDYLIGLTKSSREGISVLYHFSQVKNKEKVGKVLGINGGVNVCLSGCVRVLLVCIVIGEFRDQPAVTQLTRAFFHGEGSRGAISRGHERFHGELEGEIRRS